MCAPRCAPGMCVPSACPDYVPLVRAHTVPRACPECELSAPPILARSPDQPASRNRGMYSGFPFGELANWAGSCSGRSEVPGGRPAATSALAHPPLPPRVLLHPRATPGVEQQRHKQGQGASVVAPAVGGAAGPTAGRLHLAPPPAAAGNKEPREASISMRTKMAARDGARVEDA